MTDLELRHLRVFVAVVEAGTRTRAARALGISQSTVSETLSALERTLGTPVFRKEGKGAVLTPSGDALLPYARRMLAMSGELVGELAKVSAAASATLVVAAVESISAYVLPSRLARIRERWPRARVEVVTGACTEIRDSVAAGRSDVGLVLGAEGTGDDAAILARGRLVVVCAPAHPLAGRVASPEQLRRFDFFLSDAAGDYHDMLRGYFEAAHVSAPRTQALGAVEGVKRGVLAGAPSVGLLPAHAIAPELHDGALAEIRVTPALPRIALRIVTPSRTTTSPLVEALVDSLRGAALGPLRAG